jgi:hypothetical protein
MFIGQTSGLADEVKLLTTFQEAGVLPRNRGRPVLDTGIALASVNWHTAV